jgi:hypothetical protein
MLFMPQPPAEAVSYKGDPATKHIETSDGGQVIKQ